MKDLNWRIWRTSYYKLSILVLLTFSCTQENIELREVIRLTNVEAATFLSKSQVDDLFAQGAMIVSDTDSTQVMEYSFKIDKAYASIDMIYLSGQKGFFHYAYKLFEHDDGYPILLVGKYAGTSSLFEISELSAFSVKETLMPYEEHKLKEVLRKDFFLKSGFEERDLQLVLNSMNTVLDFSTPENTFSVYNSFNISRPLFDQNTTQFKFQWTGSSFQLLEEGNSKINDVP